MAKRWYGSLQNRLEEDRQFCPVIEVGTGLTEYFWSDRKPYEVVSVKDQKHVTVRELDHELAGEPMSNNWRLVSNESNPVRELEKRGKVWYWTSTVTAEELEGIDEDMDRRLRLVLAGFDIDRIREKGKQTRRFRAKVSFGHADYYYDYEF